MPWPGHLADGGPPFGAAQINPIIDAIKVAGGGRNGNGYDLDSNGSVAVVRLTDTYSGKALMVFADGLDFVTQAQGVTPLPGAGSIAQFGVTTSGGTMTGGSSTTATLTPVPLGVNGADVGHRIYISGGTGTAEAVLITGGTAVSGASSGTLTFTPANSHSGAWKLGSATDGVAEVIYAAAGAGNAEVCLAGGGYTFHAKLTTPPYANGNITLRGSGIATTYIARAQDYPTGDLIYFEPTGSGINIRDLDIQNGGVGTLINNTSGAAIHFKNAGTVASLIENVRVINGYQGIYLEDSSQVTIAHCWYVQTAAYWTAAYPSQDGILITGTVTANKIINFECIGLLSTGNQTANGIHIQGSDGLVIIGGGLTSQVGINIDGQGSARMANITIIGVIIDDTKLFGIAINGTPPSGTGVAISAHGCKIAAYASNVNGSYGVAVLSNGYDFLDFGDNHISGYKYGGYYLSGSTSTAVTVNGGQLIGNGDIGGSPAGCGMVLVGATGLMISAVRATNQSGRAQQYGIAINGACTGLIAVCNLRGNGVAGTLDSGTGGGYTLSNNIN